MQSVIELINNNKHTYTCTEYIASNIVVDRYCRQSWKYGCQHFSFDKK